MSFTSPCYSSGIESSNSNSNSKSQSQSQKPTEKREIAHWTRPTPPFWLPQIRYSSLFPKDMHRNGQVHTRSSTSARRSTGPSNTAVQEIKTRRKPDRGSERQTTWYFTWSSLAPIHLLPVASPVAVSYLSTNLCLPVGLILIVSWHGMACHQSRDAATRISVLHCTAQPSPAISNHVPFDCRDAGLLQRESGATWRPWVCLGMYLIGALLGDLTVNVLYSRLNVQVKYPLCHSGASHRKVANTQLVTNLNEPVSSSVVVPLRRGKLWRERLDKLRSHVCLFRRFGGLLSRVSLILSRAYRVLSLVSFVILFFSSSSLYHHVHRNSLSLDCMQRVLHPISTDP